MLQLDESNKLVSTCQQVCNKSVKLTTCNKSVAFLSVYSMQSVVVLVGVLTISKNKLYAWKPSSTMLLQTNSMAFREISD